MQQDYKALIKAIGYDFKDANLLRKALTHTSYSNEHRVCSWGNYERLEFIGDAILEMISSLKLYRDYPDEREGNLTKMRASLVCEEALSRIALEKLDLPGYILLGRGEDSTGGRDKPSILCDVVEAIIGAIYLDGGIEPATDFVESFILDYDLTDTVNLRDNKTILQELVQAKGRSSIEYKIIKVEGEAHKSLFTSAVYIDGVEAGRGEGNSKKSAQQNAAGMALRSLTAGGR